MTSHGTWTGFDGERRLASGAPAQVVAALKAQTGLNTHALLVFDDDTGRVVDIDWRGSLDEVLARCPQTNTAADETAPQDRGPGRPKLGVVSREVTLLPRHWTWLSERPGGASVALRKLVDAARAASVDEDRRRAAQGAADRFMRTMAGDQPGYEEAARALYAGDRDRFEALIKTWPADIAAHTRHLAEPAFAAIVGEQAA